MAMAQTQTEHTNSPAITDSTIQWACQNRWKSERLDDVNGATDDAMSVGFMGRPFGGPAKSGPEPRPRLGPRFWPDRVALRAGTKESGPAAASRAPTKTRNFAWTRASPITGGPK